MLATRSHAPRGFAVVEHVVVAALVAVLAAMTTPSILHRMDAGRRDTAQGDVGRIATAIHGRTAHDVSPMAIPGVRRASSGARPRLAAGAGTWSAVRDIPGSTPRADPWDHAYVVLTVDENTTWVLSAGPDGVLETTTDDLVPRRDDIGHLIRR